MTEGMKFVEEKEDCGDDDDDTIVLPPPLWHTPIHFRMTRKGKILKTVSERYLRQDLNFGFRVTAHTSRKRNAVITTTGPAVRIDSIQDLLLILVSSSMKKRLVICDTNVLIHNLDVLEHPSCALANIVIPQTALLECRHRSFTAYNRIVELIRSSSNAADLSANNKVGSSSRQPKGERSVIFFPDVHHTDTQLPVKRMETMSNNTQAKISTINDENDKRIRLVATFFGKAMNECSTDEGKVEVILLSDDKACRNLARIEQMEYLRSLNNDNEHGAESKIRDEDLLYTAKSVRQHVKELEDEDPDLGLLDLVANFSSSSSVEISTVLKKNVQIFTPHLSQKELSIGVKAGTYFQGNIRAERGSHDNCYVTVRKGEDRIAVRIIGSQDINRAVDGDIVVVQLHPVSMWFSGYNDSDSGQQTSKKQELKSKENDVGIATETAEPSIKDEDNITDSLEVPLQTSKDGSFKTTSIKRPTGKVVGIIRRNFRQNYCGSIYSTVASLNNELDEGSSEDIDIDSKRKRDNEGNERTRKNENNGGEKSSVKLPRKTEKDIIAEKYEQEHPDGTTTNVFFAVDARVPPILIRTTQRDRLLGSRILVAIDSWPSDSMFPLGHYVKTLGICGKKDVETEVLLHEHNIPCNPFPAKVLACLPPEDYKIEMQPGRLDLRHLPVLSIDPPGCKDIDDALHCIVLPNGNYQVGVHIADVTQYVKAGTPIDLEAANRSTSTYLVNKRLDMFPGLLTTDLCSLKGNVDRFAFSVLWEVSPEADIINVDFKKTIIHSIAALTYQQAQIMIDLEEDGGDIKAGAVKRLASLARKFRAKRINAGALTLASPEVKFVLDSESLNPTDVQAYQLFEANALVEEFMLLANVTVSKKILRHYPTLSVLRRHPAPNRAMFDSLISKAECRGFNINIDDSKRLADSLDDAVIESDPYFNKLLRILSTRCMSPAQYFCSGEFKPTEWHHYGLAAPVYTHFTSPIRRYADVCVHRLLAAAIGVEPLPVHLSSKSYLHDLAANMNRRHRSAQLAGRASVQLHTLIFFSGEGGEREEDAYVLDVNTGEGNEPSFTVIVPKYGIEGRVKLSHLSSDDPNLVREPKEHRIWYRGNAGEAVASVQVFEKVRVKIWVRYVQEGQRELVLDLISPTFSNDSMEDTENNDDETDSFGQRIVAKEETKRPEAKVKHGKNSSRKKRRKR